MAFVAGRAKSWNRGQGKLSDNVFLLCRYSRRQWGIDPRATFGDAGPTFSRKADAFFIVTGIRFWANKVLAGVKSGLC